MREILFRGKETSDGTWAEGYYMKHTTSICGSDSGSFHSIHTKPLDPETGERVVEVSPETVGQFTGLFDKNGKKIFEGDIIKNTCVDRCYAVGYNERNAAFEAKIRVGFLWHFTHLERSSEIHELIGNIHDNPELLEAGK